MYRETEYPTAKADGALPGTAATSSLLGERRGRCPDVVSRGPVWVSRKETTELEATDPDFGTTTVTTEETMLKSTALALSGELVLLPVQHFGLILGPNFHFPLSGSSESKAPAADGVGTTVSEAEVSTRSFGIHAGFLGWFGG